MEHVEQILSEQFLENSKKFWMEWKNKNGCEHFFEIGCLISRKIYAESLSGNFMKFFNSEMKPKKIGTFFSENYKLIDPEHNTYEWSPEFEENFGIITKMQFPYEAKNFALRLDNDRIIHIPKPTGDLPICHIKNLSIQFDMPKNTTFECIDYTIHELNSLQKNSPMGMYLKFCGLYFYARSGYLRLLHDIEKNRIIEKRKELEIFTTREFPLKKFLKYYKKIEPTRIIDLNLDHEDFL